MVNENLEKLVSLARDKKASAFKDTFRDEVNGRLSSKIADMKEKLAKTMFAKKEAISEGPKNVEHTHGDVTHSHEGGDVEHSHDDVEHSHGDMTHSHPAGDAEHTHEGKLPPALQKAVDAKKKGKDDDEDEKNESKKDDDEDEDKDPVGKYEGKDGGEGDKAAYQKFFQSMLKKYGVKEPDELSPEEKKKFYDEVDAGWKGDNESD